MSNIFQLDLSDCNWLHQYDTLVIRGIKTLRTVLYDEKALTATNLSRKIRAFLDR